MPGIRMSVPALAFAIVAMTLAGCSAINRNPAPESAGLDEVVAVPGPIRMWGDAQPKNIEAIKWELNAQRRAANRGALDTRNYLALSGGGSDGAFGAGLLAGWSGTGSRPKFDVVTGISTGALIAPFAFLGPAYDAQLKEAYTTHRLNDIALRRPLISMVAEASIASDAPLVGLVDRFVSSDLLAAIAKEHRKGRRLLIGTTHLDAQRPVIWDMGEIAMRGDQNAIELFRKIMIASASVPGVFPPVLVTVDQAGKSYDEMHVDGGVASQVFLFPTQFDPRALNKRQRLSPARRLFIIQNRRLGARWKAVEPSIVNIASRSISSLTKYQGRADLDRMYFESRNHHIDYNLASIPSSFDMEEKEPFDLAYMRALFDIGYALGREGYSWQKKPPDF